MASGQHGVGNCGQSGGTESMKFEYLATMLDTTIDQLSVKPSIIESILWQNAEQYKKELAQIKQKVSDSYKQLVARAVANHLVTESEAPTLHPKISLTVYDNREDKSVHLPSERQ